MSAGEETKKVVAMPVEEDWVAEAFKHIQQGQSNQPSGCTACGYYFVWKSPCESSVLECLVCKATGRACATCKLYWLSRRAGSERLPCPKCRK
jgi:hypothetical protein